MKIVVTHTSPDLDAIASIWLIRRFLPGWEEATIRFVPAGERIANSKFNPSTTLRTGIQNSKLRDPIETIGEDEVIHVDTGLGPLDHHETSDENVSAASRTWDFIQTQSKELSSKGRSASGGKVESSDRIKVKKQAIDRMVKVAVAADHFKEVFWDNPTADYHEFSLLGLIDGLKFKKPDQDVYCTDFVIECLDALLHTFENRIWAEREIKENGKEFTTKFGKGIGFTTINDTVIKLSQKMGYVLVVRKDPRKGYVRIKARPSEVESGKLKVENRNIDLTLVYEKLKKMDPDATWFLHVSKKMLLNGTVKNPKMIPTKLSLDQIISVLETI